MIRLSGLQLRILGALNECPRPTQQEIATATEAHQSSVSRSIRKLVGAGLVTQTEKGYEITPHGGSALRARGSGPGKPGASAWPDYWGQQARSLMEQARRVEEEVAALQKPVADMFRLYQSAAVAPLQAQVAEFNQQFSRQLQLLAAPVAASAHVRLVNGIQAGLLERLADAEAAQVRSYAAAYKKFEQHQLGMATTLAEVAQQADWVTRTTFMKAMLPATTALETYAELALKRATIPQMVGTDAFLKAVESSVEQYQGFCADALRRVGENASTRAGVMLGEMFVGGRVLEQAVRPLRDIRLALGSQHTLGEITPNFYGVLARQASQMAWEAPVLSERDVEAELQDLATVRVADAALALVETRYRCNRQAQLLGTEVPLRPTVDTELISAMLPQTTVTDEAGFRVFIDWLYKYVYESTAELKRLLKYLPEEECVTALHVKFLRVYYFHDLEHGRDNDAGKKCHRVAGIFGAMIAKPYPETTVDWQAVQLSLLQGLGAMVHKLLGCLRNGGSAI